MRKILWPGLLLLGLALVALWAFVARPSVPDALADRWWSLIALALLAGVTLRAFRSGGQDSDAGSASASAIAPKQVDAATATSARPAQLLVRGAAVATRCGHDPDTVLQALGSQPPMPAPDPDCLDDQGLPRLSARCSALDTSRVTAALMVLTSGPAGRPGLVRALALQADALDGLQATLQAMPHRGGLDVRWTVPDHWSDAELELAQAWLKNDLRARMPPDAGPLTLRTERAAGPAAWLNWRSRRGLETETHPSEARPMLVMACDSLVDPQHELAAAVPGEAAAALLIEMPPSEEASSAQDGALAHLSWPIAPASPPPAERSLQDLAAQALDAGSETVVVGRVISDIGLAGPEARQVLDAIVELLPQLDVGERLCRIGLACGNLGCAGPLVALALASHASHQDEAAALLLLTGRQPVAALLTPKRLAALSPA